MKDSAELPRIPRRARISIALRTFLLEAGWNNRGKQNLGFCFSILPALKTLYSGNALIEAAKRHLSVFNTNPCFSGLVAGAIVEQEAHEQVKEKLSGPRMPRMKSTLGSTFGALGDDLIWLSFKPFLAVLAVLLFLLGHEWAFLWLVVPFSLANIILRFRGVELGLRGATAVRCYFEKTNPKHASAALKRATCVLLGALAGVLLSWDYSSFAECSIHWFGFISVLPIIVVCFILRSRNVSSGKVGAVICALVLVGILLTL
ncbi:MAG TPA: PTS system mannose/fructose/sorbose family transporter subunit IID [bacterium]|nr:PTS system mannose/fructose/sorbose family transporter subunit IID [bacterium]